jgi:hypothetical protein
VVDLFAEKSKTHNQFLMKQRIYLTSFEDFFLHNQLIFCVLMSQENGILPSSRFAPSTVQHVDCKHYGLYTKCMVRGILLIMIYDRQWFPLIPKSFGGVVLVVYVFVAVHKVYITHVVELIPPDLDHNITPHHIHSVHS